MIHVNLPRIGKEEIEAVVKVMESGQLTNALGAGPCVREFEKNFAEFASVKNAVAVNTGTAALHSALVAADIRRGDEVILPSFTFVATAESIIMAGGKPVFVDIEPETYNVCVDEIEGNITKRTKAIMPVDLYGYSADLKPIAKIANRYNLTVIEDAAQAHGATYDGKPAGVFAHIVCWSLYASKNITSGEGGVITTNSDEIDNKLRLIRTHGEKLKYSSIMLGYNYRMSEIQAAIGLVQLRKLPIFLAARRRNAKRLNDILGETEKLQLPKESNDRHHSWYLYTVRLKDAQATERNKIVDELRKRGIGAEVYYINPVHLMPYYRKIIGRKDLPETEKAANQVFSLPIHPGVSEEQIDFIGQALLDLL